MENISEQTMTFLKDLVEHRFHKNVSEASRFLGLDTSSGILRKWLTGERSPTLEKIATVYEKLGVTLHFPDDELIEYDFVRKVAAKAGAGSSLETSDEVEGMYAFRKDFMVAQHINAKNCILLDVRGDSMEPLIKSGDMILVDTTDKEVQDGKTYLVAYGDDLRVKHIFKSPQGLILRSENQRYADITIRPDELGSYAIIHGRVRWFARMM